MHIVKYAYLTEYAGCMTKILSSFKLPTTHHPMSILLQYCLDYAANMRLARHMLQILSMRVTVHRDV